MPLLDHFHPPLSLERRWDSFHSNWATKIADALTERWLPPEYIAEEHAHVGSQIEIEVATLERGDPAAPIRDSIGIATMPIKAWAPPDPDAVLPATFLSTFEIRVLSHTAGPRLVAVIELVSPGNKDRVAERQAFAIKCASFLVQGVSLIIVDIVTNRRANLHNEILQLLQGADIAQMDSAATLYAVAYRPLLRAGKEEIDIWRTPLTLGQPLPTLPLSLSADVVIPVDFEATYAEACLRKRLTGS